MDGTLTSVLTLSAIIQQLRDFFAARNCVDVHTQDRLSILAACEDPSTLTTFELGDQTWPQPQTGQMWLEHDLLTHPQFPGFCCLSTSFRDEPHPIPGRHRRVFPMFEFEIHGDMETLIAFECDILRTMGFREPSRGFPRIKYNDVLARYDVSSVGHEAEQRLWEDFGPVVFITDFPEESDPFWNMKRDPETRLAHKVDVILCGMETIGSAERSIDQEQMKQSFHTLSGGKYAETLYEACGRERVDAELEEFLSMDFVPRCGGGIGLARLIRALEIEKLLPEAKFEQVH